MKTLLCALVVAALSFAVTADTDLTGKWTGTFADSNSGESQPALLILKQAGNNITGSGGPSEDQQFPITKGTREGDKVTLEVEHESQKILLELKLDGDHLKGQLTMSRDGEKRTATLDVARAK